MLHSAARPGRLDQQDSLRHPLALALVIGVVIVWGSLYPFRFEVSSSSTAYREAFELPFDSGDLTANVMFYFPFGLFLARSLSGVNPFAGTILAALLGAALSLGLELAQCFEPARAPNIWDFAGNTLGVFAGAFASLLHWSSVGPRAVILSSFIASRITGSPTPPLQSYPWLLPAVQDFVAVLAIALVFEPEARPKTILRFGGCVVAAYGLRWLIEEGTFPRAELAGFVLGAAVWWIALRTLPQRKIGVLVLFMLWMSLEALSPFVFSAQHRGFGLTPFVSLIRAPREIALGAALFKVFSYGTFLWMMQQRFPNLKFGSIEAGTLIAATFVLLLRTVQTYVPGRTAEVSDMLMVLLLAAYFAATKGQTRLATG